MLDSIYHMMILKLIINHIFLCENANTLPSFMQRYNGHHYVV